MTLAFRKQICNTPGIAALSTLLLALSYRYHIFTSSDNWQSPARHSTPAPLTPSSSMMNIGSKSSAAWQPAPVRPRHHWRLG